MYTICHSSKGIVEIKTTLQIFLKIALMLQVLPSVMVYAKATLVALHLHSIPTTNLIIASYSREGLTFMGKMSAPIIRATSCPQVLFVIHKHAV